MRHVLAFALVLLASCGSPRYSYAPVHVTSAELESRPAAAYVLTGGEVTVASFGITKDREVHVVLAVKNRTNETWWVDAEEQQLAFWGGTEGVQAGHGRIEIAPQTTRLVNLFFALPNGAGSVPAFDVIWTLHANGTTVLRRTPFERFLGPAPAVSEAEPPTLEQNEPPNRWEVP